MIARVLAISLFADVNPASANLWEYGDEARNYMEHGQISFVYFSGTGDEFLAPSSYMPPGLVFVWIVLFELFGITSHALSIMLALNVILGTLIVFLTHQIAVAVTNNKRVAILPRRQSQFTRRLSTR